MSFKDYLKEAEKKVDVIPNKKGSFDVKVNGRRIGSVFPPDTDNTDWGFYSEITDEEQYEFDSKDAAVEELVDSSGPYSSKPMNKEENVLLKILQDVKNQKLEPTEALNKIKKYMIR